MLEGMGTCATRIMDAWLDCKLGSIFVSVWSKGPLMRGVDSLLSLKILGKRIYSNVTRNR